jgi:uncharacterized protein (TIGR03663 family)
MENSTTSEGVQATEMPETTGADDTTSDPGVLTDVAPEPSGRGRFLDTPIFERFDINVELLLYVLLAIIGVITRFWDLGLRAISHDESLHALYSWKLYAGQGYQHSPMMHGPFLFHANALIYALFGDNDFTARIVPALFGVAMIVLPYFLRKWLGRTGALVVALLFTISPSFLYYSRYIRNDIYITVWVMIMTIALFKYIDERKDKWLYIGSAAVMFAILTKEVAYMMGFVGVTFIILMTLWEFLGEDAHRILRAAGTIAVIVLLIAAGSILVGGSGAQEGSILAMLVPLVQYLLVVAGLIIAALFASILHGMIVPSARTAILLFEHPHPVKKPPLGNGGA